MVLVKRDGPFMWKCSCTLVKVVMGSVRGICFLRSGCCLVLLAFRPSGVYFTLAAAAVVCSESWYAEIRLIICKPSSVVVFSCMMF